MIFKITNSATVDFICIGLSGTALGISITAVEQTFQIILLVLAIWLGILRIIKHYKK